MPFKSQAQRRKFAEMMVKGEISAETFEEWNRETGSAKLPEHVAPKGRKSGSSRKKSTARKRPTASKRKTASESTANPKPAVGRKSTAKRKSARR